MTRRNLLATGAAGFLTNAMATETLAAAPDARWRVMETSEGRDITWRGMADRLARANLVFAGEFHDDPQTHRAELALLETLSGAWKQSLSLGMEMLERDAQPALDAYLAGKTDEAALKKTVKLWPNYATDYRPLVEYARAEKIPVLASNAPGPLVKRVGKEGLAPVLESLTEAERSLIAATVNAPSGDVYEKRFGSVMGAGHGDRRMDAAMVRRFYEAQCVRDDTMAETVSRALDAGRKVLHVNGAFHSDAGLGTAQRVLWRRPLRTSMVIVKFVPVREEVAKAIVSQYHKEADFLIVVPDERPIQSNDADDVRK
ncbi:MAG: ChaN family lipoprotein [Armatimonadota bacterium]